MRSVLIVLATAVALATAGAASATPDQAEATPASTDLVIDAQSAPIGAVLGRGDRVGDSCRFGELEVSQEAAGRDSVWAAIRVNKRCEVSVIARWTGALIDRPAGVLSQVEDAGLVEATFSKEGGPAGQTNQSLGTTLAAASCSTHEQQIIHYGYGGPTDRLTRLVGKMVACENATTFTSVSQTGTCYATDPPGGWTWVIERCYSGGAWYTSTTAQTIEKGDFHCSPRSSFPCNIVDPDGYDHTLTTKERKTRGGSTVCTAWLTGLDVVGSYQDIIQGCR
ncbi:MAG: hypothetical protein KatS3mg011_1488 [Acidimicrobiia bacterium]|nr:MAG: hypothetical protein KatS3mg011_1488 [Acidimicrobiia bacterium]